MARPDRRRAGRRGHVGALTPRPDPPLDRPPLDRPARDRLRAALRERYPWVTDDDRGPSSVAAGDCDRCGVRPRVLGTCGPVAWEALCRDCVLDVGLDAWCGGHADEGRSRLAWVEGLPPEWAKVCTLWWVATGEVRVRP